MRFLLPAVLGAAALPAMASAGSSPPAPVQDVVDLQARSNVVQGSGARAYGMGGAFLARADDATAASWNPAGLSYLKHPEVSVVYSGGTFTSDQVYPDGSPHQDHRSGSNPDFLAGAYPFDMGFLSGAVQVSFQRVFPFGSHRTFSNLLSDFVVDSSGGFDVLAFGTGIQVAHGLRIGATANRWFNGYDQLVDKQTPGRGESLQKTSFGLSGWNTNVGVIWSPWESLNLGAVGKTQFHPDVPLTQTRTDCLGCPAAPPSIQQSFTASLKLPAAVGVGLSWRPKSPLTFSFDYTRTFWSQGKIHDFFILQPVASGTTSSSTTPPAAPGCPGTCFPVLPYPTINDPDQQDTQQFRLGAEYVVIGSRVKVPLRAGAFTDGQYFRDSSGKAPVFIGVTAGAGLIMGPVLFDVAYVFETGDYTDLQGVANSAKSSRVLASLIYRYGGRR